MKIIALIILIIFKQREPKYSLDKKSITLTNKYLKIKVNKNVIWNVKPSHATFLQLSRQKLIQELENAF